MFKFPHADCPLCAQSPALLTPLCEEVMPGSYKFGGMIDWKLDAELEEKLEENELLLIGAGGAGTGAATDPALTACYHCCHCYCVYQAFCVICCI